jgi:hypothetical protein
MASGQITLQNLTDEQFSKLLAIKDKNPTKLAIASNQPISPVFVNVGGTQKPGFTNIVLQFSDGEGFKLAAEILEMLAT